MITCVRESAAQQPTSQLSAPPPIDQAIIDKTFKKLHDLTIPADQRYGAFQDIESWPSAQRDAAYVRLLDDPDNSTTAAIALIRSHFIDAGNLLASHMSKWSQHEKLQVLSEVLFELNIPNSDPTLLQVARTGLESALVTSQAATGGVKTTGGAIGEPDGITDSRTSTVDFEALILSKGTDASDSALLHKAIALYPRSRGLWLALSKENALTPVERESARLVYSDPAERTIVRGAAATALAPYTPEADRFVTGELHDLLREYGDVDFASWWKKILLDAMSTPRSSHPGEKLNRMRAVLNPFFLKLKILGDLRFSSASSAQPLVFEAVQANNIAIADVAGLVAADRWPEEFLKLANPKKFDQGQYAGFLALIAIRHPQLKPEVTLHLSAKEFKEASERVNSQQFGNFDGVFISEGL